MTVPAGQIAAREVARVSEAETVASAHDSLALLCEDPAAATGSRRGGKRSGDALYRRGDAPAHAPDGAAPVHRDGTAQARRDGAAQARRESAAETRQADGTYLEPK